MQLCADPAATGFTDRSESPAMTATATCPPPANDPTTGVFSASCRRMRSRASRRERGVDGAGPARDDAARSTVQRKLDKPVLGYEVGGRDRRERARRRLRRRRRVQRRRESAHVPVDARRDVPRALRVSAAVRQRRRRLEGVAADPGGRATVDDPIAPTSPAPTVPAGWQRTATVASRAQDNTGVRTISLRAGDRTARHAHADLRLPAPAAVPAEGQR